jgi:hypothetical protein
MSRLESQACNINSFRRILVVNNGSLLDEGVTSLLASQAGLQVSSIGFENEAALARDIARIHPDVIVLSQSGLMEPERFLESLDNIPDPNGLRLIVIHPSENTLDVYYRQQSASAHSEDFIALVQSDEAPL